MRVGLILRGDVDDLKSLANWVAQQTGTPRPKSNEWGKPGKAAKDFFKRNPQADWVSLCGVAEWSLAKKKRFDSLMVLINMWPHALEDGFMKELEGEVPDRDVEARIRDALEREKDPSWRVRLLASQGVEARTEMIKAWEQFRG